MRIFMILLALVLAAGIVMYFFNKDGPEPPTGTSIDFTIDLNPIGPPGPVNNPGTFNVENGNQGCLKGSGERKGCMRFNDGESGNIIFTITGNPNVGTCEDQPPPQRVVSEVKLTTTDNTPGPVPSDKGNFQATSYPLADNIRDDGFPALNVETGVVFPATAGGPGSTRVSIENRNASNVSNPGGMDIWYRVTVKRCSDDLVWVTDPRIENEGMD